MTRAIGTAALAVVLSAVGCADPKAPEYPCIVEARAEYAIYDNDYYRAQAVYRRCLQDLKAKKPKCEAAPSSC
jgi:hypothetical protein